MRIKSSRKRQEVKKFQSLFSWKYNCEVCNFDYNKRAASVSILVFMEVQL
ncbi:Uncharacterized protein dnl_30410 [Desulfonema limicola]|uniref:Uncharacterized protein n=1 Tax=Desulfonema limicola TaxID=45656 RepID=A0A975GGZ7_9BACT|nr:Uncharacterized protein dnl_30410 [Desulfonema limicola]